MALNGQRVAFEELAILAGGDVLGTYVLASGPYQHAIRILLIDNTTDSIIVVSFDGVTDHMVLPPSSGKVIDFATNRVGPVDQLEQPIGTTVYVRAEGGLPTVGSVYVSAIYASNK